MKALFLALLVSQALDAGLPADAPVAETTICLGHDDAMRVAQHLARLEAENDSLRTSVKEAPVARWVLVGAGAGLVVGAVVAGVIAAAVKKP